MSVKLFKQLIHKRYPEFATSVFNTEQFAESIGNLMLLREFRIGDMVHLTQYMRKIREKVEPNSTPLRLESIDLGSSAMNIPENASPFQVLVATAAEDRNSSGGEDEDVEEQLIQEKYRNRLKEAVREDIKRIFPRLTMVEKFEHANVVAGILHIYTKELQKYIN